ncbi:MAG: Flp pilus assembly protein CpaB [Alphaproteobacteria bacterium]|nr:Flp pilus assembly protein CpaB [Alphaproteobacteria bacterium]
MNPRSIILIGLAVLFAGGTVFVANSWLNAQRAAFSRKAEQPVKKAPENFILVARANLPAGTLLKPDHLRWQAWPEASISKAYIRREGTEGGSEQKKAFTGAVVRKGITIGEPITEGRVVKPGQRGFMAAVLHPNMRAIAVRVSATTASAGFIFPGDRVDMLLTHKRKGSRRVAETIFTNARVLAIDQRTSDQSNKAKVAKTVTLEVTPKQVEMIHVARGLGTLSLSLRALARPASEAPIIVEDQPDTTTTMMANDAPAPAAVLGTHLAFNTGGPEDQACAPVLEEQQNAANDNQAAATEPKPAPLIPQNPAACGIYVADAAPASQVAVEQAALRAPAPRLSAPQPTEEQIAPSRGTTHTVASEVSRVIGWKGTTVTVLRGRKSSTARVKPDKFGMQQPQSGEPAASGDEDDEAPDGGAEESGE